MLLSPPPPRAKRMAGRGQGWGGFLFEQAFIPPPRFASLRDARRPSPPQGGGRDKRTEMILCPDGRANESLSRKSTPSALPLRRRCSSGAIATTFRLWRVCALKSCRRNAACGGDANHCLKRDGTRAACGAVAGAANDSHGYAGQSRRSGTRGAAMQAAGVLCVVRDCEPEGRSNPARAQLRIASSLSLLAMTRMADQSAAI
jgi:hypothetical protein